MLSSGITAIATTDDNPVTLIANASKARLEEVTVVNTGTVAGFVSIDGGTTWIYMPAGTASGPSARTFNLRANPITGVVKAKRIAGGTDMSGLYADAL